MDGNWQHIVVITISSSTFLAPYLDEETHGSAIQLDEQLMTSCKQFVNPNFD